MTQTGAPCKVLQSFPRITAVCSSSGSWNQAILCEREPRNQVVKLKYEAYLVPEQLKPIAMPVDFDTVD